MADDPARIDPKGTMETVPPPKGASDAYSAQTRVGTLPEHVLEAMRAQETDAKLASRTKSGMRAAAKPVPALAQPPVPSFPAVPAAEGQSRPQPPPLPWSRLASPRPMRAASPADTEGATPLPRPSPLAPLALTPGEAPPSSRAPSVLPPAVLTPQEGWLAGPPSVDRPSASMRAPEVPAYLETLEVPVTYEEPNALHRPLALVRGYLPASLVRALERVPADLVRSIIVIAVFALLGALVAAAITLAGH